MDQTSPPWRVFDAPAGGPAASGDVPAGGAAPEHRPAPSIPPVALAAIAGAVGIGALAIVVALGGANGAPIVPSEPVGSGAALEVIVDVAGAVARPGVYRLPEGSRVGDAISAAGGFSPRVAAERVDEGLNLAAILRDGERIVVPSRDDANSGGAAGNPDGAGGGPDPTLIALNTATQAELESLPGIGPVTAGKIIAAREEAPFQAVDDLRSRGLVGPSTFEQVRALVTVD